MKINIIFPFPPQAPVGGCKVLYTYANILADKNHEVHIYHSLNTSHFPYKKPYILRYLYYTFLKTTVPTWFKLNPKIRVKNIPIVKDKYIDDADVVISTWWATAFEVYKLNHQKGIKFNFIQDYEIWTGHQELVRESYSLKNHKITYAKYLQQLIKENNGGNSFYISPGIDSNFQIITKIEDRDSNTVCMMFSSEPRKGSAYGLEALMRVKKEIQELKVILFGVGVGPKPHELPVWIDYFQKPDNLELIYNRAAVFVSPSLQEGWGLPCTEAMSCGCALVCSTIPAHDEFANSATALRFEKENAEEMAKQIIVLLKDNKKRIELAYNGKNYIHQFNWHKSADQLELLFNRFTKHEPDRLEISNLNA